MREPVRELAVVRQQQRAGRVGVEAADGNDARLVADEVDDRATRVRIARSGDDPGGLVQQHVRELLLRDGPAVYLDAVVLGDERVQLSAPTVHSYAAGLDQLVGL